jgi:ATP-binding cassette subfamily B multidrug efflux pump
MLKWSESLLEPTGIPPSEPPSAGLARFYWHFMRQLRWSISALFVTGLLVALLDVTIPLFIGRVVTLVSTYRPSASSRMACAQLLSGGRCRIRLARGS